MGRSARKLGGWAALFALALQFTLAFGHVHPDSFAAAPSGITVAAQPSDGHAPDGQDSDHPGCDICAVIHLAGTVLLPATPAIALVATAALALPAAEPPALASGKERAFHARAPPQA